MNHIELHNTLSETLTQLKSEKINPKLAKEIFNGAGKLIANCRNELIVANMGIAIDIPLLGISKEESRALQGNSLSLRA